MSQNDTMGDYLAKHPRMISVLFTVSVMLMQAGTVLADKGANGGP